MKIALLFIALSAAAAHAQSNVCDGLRWIKDGAKPVYPPIARAAHVEGVVTLLVSFTAMGDTDSVQVENGPLMLQQAAVDYAKRWRANKFSELRTCLVQITYIAPRTTAKCRRGHLSIKRTDPQHVTVKGGGTVCIMEEAEQA